MAAASHLGPLSDPDSWWHLRLGDGFIDRASLSAPKDWSTFATSNWVPTQPLPEVASALIYRTFGLAGVVWLYAATVVLLIAVVYLLNRRQAAPLPAVLATLLFVAAGANAFAPRPELVSYMFLAVVIAAWLRTEEDLRPRWWLVCVSWLWSLCHGFWFLGVLYGALAVLGVACARRATLRELLRLSLVPVGSAVIVLLNPVGWRVFAAPFVVSARSEYIVEWQRASILSTRSLIVVLMVGLCAAVWALRKRDATWFKVFIAVSALILAWYALRTVVLGGLVMAPLVASAVQTLRTPTTTQSDLRQGSLERERIWLGAGISFLLVLVAIMVPRTASEPAGVPLTFDASLDHLPEGTTVFNDYALGGWLAWRHPDLNRWVDGLADAYPVAHLHDTAMVMSGASGWRAIVRRSGATFAILPCPSVAQSEFEQHGWRRLGTDENWVLLRLAHSHGRAGAASGSRFRQPAGSC
jgi:hypothetical protein